MLEARVRTGHGREERRRVLRHAAAMKIDYAEVSDESEDSDAWSELSDESEDSEASDEPEWLSKKVIKNIEC